MNFNTKLKHISLMFLSKNYNNKKVTKLSTRAHLNQITAQQKVMMTKQTNNYFGYQLPKLLISILTMFDNDF